MNRISARIAAALTQVQCPACGKPVVPQEALPPPEETPPATGPKRWSFIWLAPSGPVCPACGFPLGRYARRLKWIRLLATGVVLVTVSLLLFAMGMMRGGSRWGWVIPRAFGVVGLAALLLGLAGVIVGGRRDGT